MDTLMLISDWITKLLDAPLGWLLLVYRDLAVFIVAVGTSLLLTLARKWTTDQGQLRRGKEDLKRLKQLRREAKRNKDKEALGRIRTTVGMINITRMRAEGLPVLVSLIPIAFLACWCYGRLGYFAPSVGETVEVRAYYPASSISEDEKLMYTHLLPPSENTGLELLDDPIQEVKEDPQIGPGGEINGLATWTLKATRKVDDAELVFRHQGETAVHPFSAGGRIHPLALQLQTGKFLMTELKLREAKFLGILPSIPQVFLPSWLLAYLLIVIPFVPLLRRVLRVY